MDTNVNNTETDHKDDLELETNASETQILTWRTLIDIVKANPVLYERKHKGLYRKRSDKFLTWNRVGASLIPPMTGIDAEKEFYRLRQKFGKERRKVLQPRSGAGGNDIGYKSNWILYNDLMFLADHIQPRQTTWNYPRPMAVHQKISNFQATQQLVISRPLTCTPSSNESSVFWNKFESVTECIEDEKKLSRKMDSKDSCLSAVFAPSKSSGNASSSVLKTMTSTIVPSTSPSNINKKRKQGSADEMDVIMIELNKNVSLLNSILQTALKEKMLPTALQQLVVPGVTSEVQTMMGSIALGFSKVPMEHQMDCLIHVLSCINEFAKK